MEEEARQQQESCHTVGVPGRAACGGSDAGSWKACGGGRSEGIGEFGRTSSWGRRHEKAIDLAHGQGQHQMQSAAEVRRRGKFIGEWEVGGARGGS